MVSFDTNIAVHAANSASPHHRRAYDFLSELGARRDVAICELMLVELYLKLRNERIFPSPMSAAQAASHCQQFRNNRVWMTIDSAPVMDQVWRRAAARNFAFRRIIDLRLALTLRHHGVAEFATSNLKDFAGVGFERLWDPLAS